MIPVVYPNNGFKRSFPIDYTLQGGCHLLREDQPGTGADSYPVWLLVRLRVRTDLSPRGTLVLGSLVEIAMDCG